MSCGLCELVEECIGGRCCYRVRVGQENCSTEQLVREEVCKAVGHAEAALLWLRGQGGTELHRNPGKTVPAAQTGAICLGLH